MNEKFNSRSLLITGLILTFLNTLILFTIIGKGVYDQITARGKEGTIVLANVNPEEANAISKQFTYQATTGETQEYYSPTLDTLIKYNPNTLFLSDSIDSVSISRRGTYNAETYSSLRIMDGEFSKAESETYLKSLYDDVKIEEESKIEGLNAIRFSYVKKSYIDDTKAVYNNLYIYRVVGGKTLYVTIIYPSSFNATSLSSEIAKVMVNSEVSPKNVSEKIKLILPKPGVEVMYDRQKWVANSTTEYTAYIEYRSKEFESNKDNQFAINTVSINASSFIEGESLEEAHSIYYKYDSEAYKKDDFKFIKEKSTKELNGKSYLYTEYTYTFFGSLNTSRVYTTLSKDGKFAVTIKLWSSKANTDGQKEAEELFKTIKFVDTSSTDELSLSRLTGDSGNVLGSSSLTIDKSALIAKPSVVHIYNKTCVDIKVSSQTGFTKTPNGTYKVCGGGFGTGFFISSDGYLITNGHVASPHSIDAVVSSLVSGGDITFWTDLSYDIAELLYKERGINLASLSNTDILLVVLSTFMELNNQGGLTLTPTYNNFIENTEPFVIDPRTFDPSNATALTEAKTITAQVDSQFEAQYNYAKGDKSGIKTPDLAILKIDDNSKQFPSLRLSSAELITSGMPIHVLGFPGIVNQDSIFASSASQIPTITNGTIGAVKPNSTGAFKLIQIDASISGGNSGGPIVNSEGEVVGVATYGISDGSSSGDYNIGVSAEEITKLLASNSVKINEGKVTEYLNDGVENFEKEYYKFAIKDFKKVIELYPDSESILNPLIAISEKKIADGDDKTPFIDTRVIERGLAKVGIKVSGNTVLVGVVSAIGLVISLLFLFVVLAMKRRKDKKEPAPVIGNYDTPVTPPPSVETPPVPVATEPSVQVEPVPVQTPSPTLVAPPTPTMQEVPAQQPTPATTPTPPAPFVPVAPVMTSTPVPQADIDSANTVVQPNNQAQNTVVTPPVA
ncbi:trypsin-like peptidase domain-containing protein [Candidatus Dojkabacteria bacterium]|nr:trypsin-like peptidase domain-containing protein [Candidatus Dojkabacteria bacterium]